MPELTQPPLGRKPNIPPVVPLTQASTERQEEYKDLFGVAKDAEAGDPVAPVDADNQPKAIDPLITKPEEPPVSDEDKLAFVESILGEKPYSKSYQLFGGKVSATFQDRSVGDSEAIYARLDEDYSAGKIKSEEQWQIGLERYHMACGLKSVKIASSNQNEVIDLRGDFKERLQRLMQLPQPVYRALMNASRAFEGEVNFLVEKANDPDFWAAGG